MWWVLISYALFAMAATIAVCLWAEFRSRPARWLTVGGLLAAAWVLVSPLTPSIRIAQLRGGPIASVSAYRSALRTYDSGPYREWLGASSVLLVTESGQPRYRLLVHAAPALSFAESTADLSPMCGVTSQPCPAWFLNHFGANMGLPPSGTPRPGDEPLVFVPYKTGSGEFVIASSPADGSKVAWTVRVGFGLSWWRTIALVFILSVAVRRAALTDRRRRSAAAAASSGDDAPTDD